MFNNFDATPRVIHQRQKYNTPADQQEITYQKLMDDEKIRFLNPSSQEKEYLKLESERIKLNSMQTQLLNFKKQKKVMTPYELKPEPNPRIEANLQFFLNDNNNQAPQLINIDTQTDQFKDKPKDSEYVPKKTGIDICTQVEDYELFNFDQEVFPIVNVIVTKTLQQSTLEIEEETQVMLMSKYQSEFYERRKMEKARQQKILRQEFDKVKEQKMLLEEHREKDLQQNQIQQKMSIFKLSSNFMKNIESNCFKRLQQQGYYQNKFQNLIETKFLEVLVQEVSKEVEKIQSLEKEARDITEKMNLLQGIKDKRKDIDRKIQHHKESRIQRRYNLFNDQKKIVRLYYMAAPQIISSFTRYLEKLVDSSFEIFFSSQLKEITKTENQSKTESQQQEINFNSSSNDMTTSVILPSNFNTYRINDLQKILFSYSINKFYKSQNQTDHIEIGCLIFDEDYKLMLDFDKNAQKTPYFNYKKNLWDLNLKVNQENGIVINFKKLPAKATAIVLYLIVKDITKKQLINMGRFQIEDYQYRNAFDSQDFEKLQIPEDTTQQTEGEVQVTSSFHIPYYFIKNDQNEWQMEQFQYQKLTQNISNEKNKIVEYQRQCQSVGYSIQPQQSLFFKNVELDQSLGFQQNLDILLNQIKNEEKDLYSQATQGFEFVIKNKKFEDMKQITKIKKNGDLQVRIVEAIIIDEQSKSQEQMEINEESIEQ